MLLKVQFKKFMSLKMKEDKNIQAFFALVRAGLWEEVSVQDSWFSIHGSEQVDWEKIYQLAEEQSVIGLVLAGIEHSYVKPPLEFLLQWIGEVQIIEQQNKAMNQFVAKLIERLRKNDIYAILVKGQGIAQCYERPLLRASGDVDLLLSHDNYNKAKNLLIPIAQNVEKEYVQKQHLALTISNWEVELHGSLRCMFWKRLDNEIDNVMNSVFYGGNVRSWQNEETQIFLPAPNEDAFFVFTHILQHFFKGGIGFRQICDWCRLLWKNKDVINSVNLEERLIRAGILSEWKTFSYLAVKFLGMPSEAMPLFEDKKIWEKKAYRISHIMMETGNFGHNRDNSIYQNKSFARKKFISLYRHTIDNMRHVYIFPIDSLKAWCGMFKYGISAAMDHK